MTGEQSGAEIGKDIVEAINALVGEPLVHEWQIERVAWARSWTLDVFWREADREVQAQASLSDREFYKPVDPSTLPFADWTTSHDEQKLAIGLLIAHYEHRPSQEQYRADLLRYENAVQWAAHQLASLWKKKR